MDNTNIIIKILTRRKRQKHIIKESSFDSSAIGDLAFLLLIFFIVTASFIIRQGIFFSLPSKDAGSIKVKKERIIEIYPMNYGFKYKGKIKNREGIKELFLKSKDDSQKKILIIYMGPKVKYDRLVDTLSLARETKMNQVSLKNTFEN